MILQLHLKIMLLYHWKWVQLIDKYFFLHFALSAICYIYSQVYTVVVHRYASAMGMQAAMGNSASQYVAGAKVRAMCVDQ